MMPTAGLFLPETLHRRDPSTSEHIVTRGVRLKYFQRPEATPIAEPAKVETFTPSIMSRPHSAASFPSLNIALDFADYVCSSNKASSETSSIADLIYRVQSDITEASRLCSSPTVMNILDDWPDKKSWILAVLADVRRALSDIGSLIETFRSPGDDGGASGLRRRFDYAMGHHKKLSSKQQQLSVCHQSLATAISMMQGVELGAMSGAQWPDPIYEAPVQPWIKKEDKEVLRGPYSRRENRLSQKNMSSSSIQLYGSASDGYDARSVRSIPVELPGSTPNNLSDAREAHLWAPPAQYIPYRPARDSGSSVGTTVSQIAASRTHPIGTSPITAQDLGKPRYIELEPSLPASKSCCSPELPLQALRRASLDSSSPAKLAEGDLASGHWSYNSLDFVHSLPTLSEKTIERNDSTTTDVIAIPRIAKRYRANPIHIRSRHQSLPVELPHLKTQPSLAEDLADWMITSPQSEKLQNKGWETSSVLSSPTMSNISSTAVNQAEEVFPDTTVRELEIAPEQRADTSHKDNSISGRFGNPSKADELFLEQHTGSQVDKCSKSITRSALSVLRNSGDQECTASMRSTTSSIRRKPLPTSASLALISIPNDPASNETSRLLEVDSTTTSSSHASSEDIPRTIDDVTKSSRSSMPLADLITSSSPIAVKAGNVVNEAEGSAPQQTLLHQSYVAEHGAPTFPDLAPEGATERKAEEAKTVTNEQVITFEHSQTSEAKQNHTFEGDIDVKQEQEVKYKPAKTTEDEKEHTTLPERAGSNMSRSSSSKSITRESKPSSPAVAPKPISAQAKRRAAHQRRMELAFGKS